MFAYRNLFVFGLLCTVFGFSSLHCASNVVPDGLFQTVQTGGPAIKFDLDAEPLPEIPLPNDLATRLDPTSLTKRRVNVSMIAPTHLESSVREKVNRLTGFAVYSPITVGFNKQLDLDDIIKRHQKNRNFEDDAVYVVNLNPASAKFGKPVLLDMGRGNFPVVLERPSNYFDHDPHDGQINILFETLHEVDSNNNGKFDPEDDLDHDGVQDKPNVHPEGADPKDGLLTFYEKQTNTLIMRPVVPLEPESTYAVILTTRLKGEDGKPIQSPFPYINHTRQTPDLRVLVEKDVLKSLGLTDKDVAFAWTFTTQSTTRDLKEIRDGLYGHGPFRALAEMYPAELTKIHPLTNKDKAEGGKVWMLKGELFREALRPLASLVLPGSAKAQVALLNSMQYIDYVVSGEFTTPYFLAARDKKGNLVTGDKLIGADVIPDSKTTFDIDRNTGRMVVGKDKVTWWCAVPKSIGNIKPPFPVNFYGHGYTSSRFEMLGFAGNLAKFGLATCGIDAAGHGTVLADNPSLLQTIETALDAVGIGGAYKALSPGRARDLNNDGIPDSGGDFWTADTFHTRDIVRQSVLDHMALIRIMRSWDGKKTWSVDADGDGKPDLTGIAGDFNGDGVVDIGGPTQDYHAWGQSLGGILSAVLAGIEPAITTAAPVAGGGGLINIGARSLQGGVVEAVFLRMMGPLVIGYGRSDGKMEIRLWVPDVNKKACSLTDAALQADSNRNCLAAPGKDRVNGVRLYITQNTIEAGDKVVITNLRSKETVWALVRKDKQGNLSFRRAVAADALDALEKRHALRLPLDASKILEESFRLPEISASGESGKVRVTYYPNGKDGEPKTDTTSLLGDPLEIVIYKKDPNFQYPEVRERITTFNVDVRFQGAIYKAGTPLFALAEGLGLQRQHPDFRRFTGFAGMILEPADPIAYAPHYHMEPITYSYERDIQPGANVLVIPTLGDMNVPVDTGIAIARAAGIIPLFNPDPRYPDPAKPGEFLTPNEVLTRNYVVEGVERMERFFSSNPDKKPILFDPDNLSEGKDGFGAPRLNPPLRLVVNTPSGVAGMRIPYTQANGAHGFETPDPEKPFDISGYMIYQVGYYFYTKGKILSDDRCLEKGTCDFIPINGNKN